tara:strand:- start:169 stop:336 length:168 start_codon:yes stop_codon:yes gene_type:complete
VDQVGFVFLATNGTLTLTLQRRTQTLSAVIMTIHLLPDKTSRSLVLALQERFGAV